MSKEKGYIKVYRDIQESDIWKCSDAFDKRSAWLDLLLLANYTDGVMILGNTDWTIHRGQVFTSVRALSDRWHWDKNHTLAYLRLLERRGMIRRYATASGTLLTLVNYGEYQGCRDTKADTKGDTKADTKADTTVPQYKKGKEELKKEKNIMPSAYEDF